VLVPNLWDGDCRTDDFDEGPWTDWLRWPGTKLNAAATPSRALSAPSGSSVCSGLVHSFLLRHS